MPEKSDLSSDVEALRADLAQLKEDLRSMGGTLADHASETTSAVCRVSASLFFRVTLSTFSAAPATMTELTPRST